MADTHRVMVRLSPELYAQLAARGSSGQPLAAIIRQTLIDYLAQQPEQPTRAAMQQPEQLQQPDDIQAQLTALATSLQGLHAHLRALTARVDALAAPQQPRAARSSRRAATEQPQQPARAAAAASEQPRQPEQLQQPEQPAYDPAKFVLGKLCPRRHEFGHTGMSLLRLPSRNCPTCVNIHKRQRRAARDMGPPRRQGISDDVHIHHDH
jgi:hypothetical protein